MKAFYNEFFHISEDGKIRDKVMLARTAVSVVLMVLCLAAMSISAYAYFSCDVSSDMNTIQSARYDFEIKNGDTVLESNTFICPGAENDTYTFTLTPNGTANNGYCKIVIKEKLEQSDGTEEKIYYTTQIFKSAEENKDRLTTLTLSVQAAGGCEITFIPQWGTSSYFIESGVTLYGAGDTIEHSITSVKNSGQTIEQRNLNKAQPANNAEQTTETNTTMQQEKTATPESVTEPEMDSINDSAKEPTTEPIDQTTLVEKPEETTNTEKQE